VDDAPRAKVKALPHGNMHAWRVLLAGPKARPGSSHRRGMANRMTAPEAPNQKGFKVIVEMPPENMVIVITRL
jgi:hypothetical protein